MTDQRLWHGGVPDLRAGDVIQPGSLRKTHPGCQICEARERADTIGASLDPIARHADRVYLTPIREYARFYASMYGRGDLYRVEPFGELQRSTEDTMETWTAPAARVVAVVDRAVLLTMSQRRRLHRMWADAEGADPLEASREYDRLWALARSRVTR